MARKFLVQRLNGDYQYMTYRQYMDSPEWRKMATEFKRAAGWRCEWCGGSKRLTIHHLDYNRLGRERPRDIEVLCWPCHEPLKEAHL